MGCWLTHPIVLIRRNSVRLWRCCGFFIQQSWAEHGDEGGSNRCSDQDGQHSYNQYSTRIRLVFRWMDLPCYIQGHRSNSCLYSTKQSKGLIKWIGIYWRTTGRPFSEVLPSFHDTRKFIYVFKRPRFWSLFWARIFQFTSLFTFIALRLILMFSSTWTRIFKVVSPIHIFEPNFVCVCFCMIHITSFKKNL